MTTELLLVRHGESEWNRQSRYAGQRDVPLSDRGKQQARRLADRLESEPLAAIYASPLQRARDTAIAIAERQRVPVTLEPRLAEIHHGLWEGLKANEVQARFPAVYTQWRTEPHRVVMPQGESLAELAARAGQVLTEVLAAYPSGKIALCSHDAVLRVLLLTSLGLSLEYFWKWHFANASLTVLESYDDCGSSAFRLAGLNATAHLDGVHSEASLQAL
jgi:alpha-ribazole phosphatase